MKLKYCQFFPFILFFVFSLNSFLVAKESYFAVKKEYDSGNISREELIKKAQEMGYSLKDIREQKEELEALSDRELLELTFDSTTVNEKNDSLMIIKKDEDVDQSRSLYFSEDSTDMMQEPTYFGYDIFKKRYEVEREGLVNPDYQLGPGDEIQIVLWGRTELRYELKISREGTLFIPNVGQLVVNGLTLTSLRKKLVNVMSRVYVSLRADGGRATTFLDVSLEKMKSINIFISGEIETPGSYRLSSFSTVFTALYKVGGPKLSGSLRSVKLIRNGKVVAEFDLYDYIVSGNKSAKIKLQNNDNIFVPKRLNTITLYGEVTSPGIFELRPDENLKSLVTYAGGLKPIADPRHVRIERIIPFERRKKGDNIYQVVDERLADIENDKLEIKELIMYDKDIVTVYKANIYKSGNAYVSINGHVKNPGRYNLYADMRISDLLLKGGGFSDKYFFKQTYLKRADLIRFDDRLLKTVIISFDLGAILEGDQKNDYLLKDRDELKIYAMEMVHTPKKVSVFGEVKNEGEYDFSENMKINDLVLLAGGYTRKAFPFEIEVYRVNPYNIKSDSLVVVYRIETGTNRKNVYKSNNKFNLQDLDVVVVREYPDYQHQRNVFIAGEIFRPGAYPLLKKGDGLRDIIARAGGLKEEAFIEGIVLVRDSIRIAADFERVINSWFDSNDIMLKDNDSIYVPSRPGVVFVEGAVNCPGSIEFVRGWTIIDYVEAAGSFHLNADEDVVVCYGPGGKSKEYHWYKNNDVMEGSTIFVAKKEVVAPAQPVNWTDILRTLTAVITSVATLIIVIGNN